MRWLLVLVGCLPFTAAADPVLVACMVTSGNWVVGAKLPPSGLMVRTEAGWQLRGYPHPYVSAVAADPKRPETLWLAAGNGAILATRGARDWRILTDQSVTELRDIAADPHHTGTFYIAHTWGLAVTRDGGQTWQDATGDRARRFTETIRVDRATAGKLVAGGEDGLYRSDDGGRTWHAAGAQGHHIMHLEQSPHDPQDWIATTMQGGPVRSRDGARTFEAINHLRVGRYLGVGRNGYQVAFDPTKAGRIALAIWGIGVAVTEDDGQTWEWRNQGLPGLEVWSCIFHPKHSGRLYVSAHEAPVYVSEDAGRSWKADGLPSSAVFRFAFVPEEAVR